MVDSNKIALGKEKKGILDYDEVLSEYFQGKELIYAKLLLAHKARVGLDYRMRGYSFGVCNDNGLSNKVKEGYLSIFEIFDAFNERESTLYRGVAKNMGISEKRGTEIIKLIYEKEIHL